LLNISENKTRKNLIDPALEKAGWRLKDKSRVGIEIPVDGYDAAPLNGITDYCLYRANGEVIAIVEAKRTSHDPRLVSNKRISVPIAAATDGPGGFVE
jgi:type I restriction enzyme R subunit